MRRAALELFRREGLKVTGVSGAHVVPPSRLAVDDVDDPQAATLDCDFLVVATKAYQVAEALKSLAAKMRGPGPRALLLLQNGWGSADEARDILPKVGIFSSIMMIGMARPAPNHVHNTGVAGPVRIGTMFRSDASAMKPLVASAQAGFLPVVYEDDIEAPILGKFLFNSCMNAIGALTGRTYGELVNSEESRRVILQLAEEGVRVVAAARGYTGARDGRHFFDSVVMPVVIPRAATHRSSMLQDVEAGRRTEIDYLNGAIARMGRRLGIEAPFNDTLSALVRVRTQ